MNHKHAAVTAAVGALVALAACNTTPPALSAAETTSSRALSTEGAVKRIRAAICEREEACGNLGADKSYADRATCARVVGHADLAAHPCPQGVTYPRADQCVDDIRRRSCQKKLGLVDEISSCTRKALCFGD